MIAKKQMIANMSKGRKPLMSDQTINLRVAICDDEIEALEQVKVQLYEAVRSSQLLAELDVFTCNNGKALIEESRRQPFDLILLDIEMPDNSGFDLAKYFGQYHKDTQLIFVSCHEGYVFDAYEYTPLWFVRKSRLEKDMKKAFLKFENLLITYRLSYRAMNGFSTKEILIKDIFYFECTKHTITAHTTTREYIAHGSLKKVEEELSRYGFIRIHKNYLVNAKHIKEICIREVLLSSGKRVDMSKDRKKDVKEAMLRYERGRN